MNIQSDIVNKLFNRTFFSGGGCWEFTGGQTGAGYGAVSRGHRESFSAHVLSYTIYNGPVTAGKYVCHTCDNKMRVNPAHLFLGTALDNKIDEVSKDRHAKGERQGHAKLTSVDVIEIRASIAQGHALNKIGKLYGVTGEAIGLIKSGKNWGWLS